MERLVKWFIYNPVAANLLMIVLLLVGFLTTKGIYREEFPNIDLEIISISTDYPGATPSEVETAVCIRIEEAIEGTPGITKTMSNAMEAKCQIQLEYDSSLDENKMLSDIKRRVEAIRSFPEEVEDPQVYIPAQLNDVIQIVIAGDTDEHSLKYLAYEMRDDLVALPGVSQVNVKYVRPFEISIEISELTLRRYNITLADVANAIQQSSTDLPAGSIKTNAGEIMVRTQALAKTRRDFEEIIVLSDADGSTLTVGDLGEVIDGFKDTDISVSFDGKPAVMIDIKRIGAEDVISLSENVQKYIALKEQQLPDGLELFIWKNESDDIVKRLELLGTNAIGGLILVLIVLAAFLKPKVALWVAIGIPIALLGTMIMFPVFSLSINTLTVMAFILVLGILVDDAVVVGERIYEYQLQGVPPKEAAVIGTVEVSTPVIFGVLTTMVAFLPFVFLDGGVSSWFSNLGIVVIVALFFSLVESQLILPLHLSKPLFKPSGTDQNPVNNHQGWLPTKLHEFANGPYRRAVTAAANSRYIVMAIALSVLIITSSLLASGRIILEFFPSVIGDRLYANLTMPAGTDVNQMQKLVRQLEQAAKKLQAELDKNLQENEPSNVDYFISSIGEGLAKATLQSTGKDGSHYAEVGLVLRDTRITGIDPAEATKRWRELTGSIAGAVELTFDASSYTLGKAVSVRLEGKDLEALKEAAAMLKEELRLIPGVFDISDTFRAGKQELALDLKPEAQTLGVTKLDLATQVREAFYGIEVQRIQRGQDDMRVMVRLPDRERHSIGDLENMMIRTPAGDEIPFYNVATVTEGRGFSAITRINGYRTVEVQADVDRAVVPPEKVIANLRNQVLPKLLARAPEVSFGFGGETEERTDTFLSLVRNVQISLFCIFALLAIPLKSYTKPLVIMAVIPFGLIGALFGHYLLGFNLQIFSLLGVVALSGVLVNSSLVMVDNINRLIGSGTSAFDAAIEAGVTRFKPIVLTSITTFVGLLPLIFNHDLASIIFVPLAISLSFGVLVGTFLTLLLLPAMYLILEDVETLMTKLKQKLT